MRPQVRIRPTREPPITATRAPYIGPAATVRDGIQVTDGAYAEIVHNTVSGNQYSGAGFASSTGVLIFGGCGTPLIRNVTVADNTLINNDIGVYVWNSSPDLSCLIAPRPGPMMWSPGTGSPIRP